MARGNGEVDASEAVLWCFADFLGCRGVDFPNWKREVGDLEGGRRRGRGGTYPSFHPSTRDGNRRRLLGGCHGRYHCD